MNQSKEKIRYVGVDSLRGWLIILVMIGHVVLGSVHDNLIRYSIYAFHMPLFIGLTGYLINADWLKNSPFMDTVTRYWWRVLFPFAFVFLFFTGTLTVHAFEEDRITFKLLLSYFYTPYYHLWFIPTLVLWVLGFSAILKSRVSLSFSLCLFLLISLIWAGVAKADLVSFLAPLLSKKVIYFFSFFLFGAWLRTEKSKKFRSIFNDFKVLPMTLITVCAGLYLINIGANKSLFRSMIWLLMNLALITLLIEMATANTHLKTSTISEIGRNSLPIYLWHVLPLFFLKGFDVHQTDPLIYYFVGVVSMGLLVFFVLQSEGKNKWIDRCLFGVLK